MKVGTGTKVIKIFLVVIYNLAGKARVFVAGIFLVCNAPLLIPNISDLAGKVGQ
jgi:hypothetical protein